MRKKSILTIAFIVLLIIIGCVAIGALKIQDFSLTGREYENRKTIVEGGYWEFKVYNEATSEQYRIIAELDEHGLLEIHTDGSAVKMMDFTDDGENMAPWRANEYINNITSVRFSMEIIAIGDYAFKGCENLQQVEEGYSILEIGESAFEGCIALNDLSSLIGAVNNIESRAFAGCESLNYIPLDGYYLESISPYTFTGCHGLEDITIPDTVTSIGEGAFLDCSSLKHINIPDTVISIGDSAFKNCNSLEEIEIPISVIEIGNDVFNGCDGFIEGSIYVHEDTKSAEILMDKYPEYQVRLELHSYFSVTDEGKAATCTEAGLTDGEHCSVCEKVLVEQTEIPALGHSYTEYVSNNNATCTEDGTETAECNHGCGTKEERIIRDSKLGHDEVSHSSKEPTCTAVGWDAYETCSRCDYSTKVEKEALGHDLENHSGKAATCTGKGWSEYVTCKREGCTYTTYREISPLGHDKVNHDAKEATCTEAGWEAYETCTRCAYTTYKEIEQLNHEIVESEGKAATCTESGWETFEYCTRGDYTTYQKIEALGHDEESHEAQEATCTEPGWNAYETCSRCDYTTKKEKAALGHTWGEWTVVEGKEIRTCNTCNATEERALEEEISTDYEVEVSGDDKNIILLPTETVQAILGNIQSNVELEVVNTAGVVIENSKIPGTGAKVVNKNTKEVVYNIVLKGDVNGDAKVDLNDAIRVLQYKAGGINPQLTGVYLRAGQLTNKTQITLNDVIKIMRYKATNGQAGF